ncbi:MAG: hypothetical protein KGL39_08635 [Patescibacteria group bacterium]|nr:hypothetical protein [Patescibacteria group bacterium]
MANFELQNFNGGLDTRRYELTSVPGSLETLVNAHINQGGEIEKRKSFQKTPMPPLVWGGQETTTSVLVFGNRNVIWYVIGFILVNANGSVEVGVSLSNGGGGAGTGFDLSVGCLITIAGSGVIGLDGTYTIQAYNSSTALLTFGNTTAVPGSHAAAGTLTMTLPSPFVYQALTHPVSGVTMTGVTSSTYFGGEAFVVTTWSNGDTLCYYGGVLVTDLTAGLQCNSNPTAYALANNLCAEATASGYYTAVAPTLNNLFFQVTSGTSGTVSVNYNFGQVQQLTPFLTTNIASIAISVPFDTSVNQTASDLATAITNATDSYAGGPGTNLGFTATAVGNQVTITSPFSIQPQDTIIVTPTGTMTVYVPTPAAVFQILSIPTTSSSKPFTVSTTLDNANLTYKLVSTGTPATAGANAAGQFTLYGGSQNAQATATITQAGQPSVGQTVTIGSQTYKFVGTLSGASNEVLIGATAVTTLSNLCNAINLGTGAGSIYGYYTPANTSASAALTSSTVVTLTAITGGTPGNLITLSTTASNYTLVAFSGGGPNTNGISQVSVSGINLLTGAVQFNQSVSQTASDLVAAINGYSGTSGFTASASAGVVTLTPLSTGTTYNGSTVIVTSTGDVVTANCHFVVIPLAGQNISSITIGSGSNIMTATITFQDAGHSTETVAQFLNRVAANINANTGVSGALSWVDANNSTIWVSQAANSSADTTSTITVTATATVSGSATALMTATGNFVTASAISGGGYVASQLPVVTVNGGVPPYNYSWSQTAVAPTGVTYVAKFNVSSLGNALTSLYFLVYKPVTVQLTPVFVMTCVVTDSSPTPQSASVNFTFVG